VDDEPRCGVYRAPNREEESKFRDPSIVREHFNLPELGLKNAQSVVDMAKSETRLMNATLKGVAGETALVPESMPTEESMNRAKELFSSICDHHGTAMLMSMGPVFNELAGVQMVHADLIELSHQLEIGPETPLTFPDAVDIVAFVRSSTSDSA
jgi:hypothetical protein